MNPFVVISGCSGGGKSTLLAELQRRGHAVVEEPGRRVVREEVRSEGGALPWLDMEAFLQRVVEMALADLRGTASSTGWVFFDRGLVDAASALEAATGAPWLATLGCRTRYHRRVFLAPPWPEIYTADPERRHDIGTAILEYERLQQVFPSLGYEVVTLPKTSVADRAQFVIDVLEREPETSL